MGEVALFQDYSGKSNQVDTNKKNIEALVTEFNRSQDLLDSLNQGLKIIAQGKLSDTYPGTPGGNTVSTQINAGQGNTFLSFYARSDRPGQISPVPEYNFDSAGNIQFYIICFTNGSSLNFQWNGYQSLTPFTWTFYYFLLQQPAASQS